MSPRMQAVATSTLVASIALVSTASYSADNSSGQSTGGSTNSTPALSTVTSGAGAGGSEAAYIVQGEIATCALTISGKFPAATRPLKTVYIAEPSQLKILTAYRSLIAQIEYDQSFLQAAAQGAAKVLKPKSSEGTVTIDNDIHLNSVVTNATPLAITDVSGAASALSSVLSLFKENISQNGAPVVISDDVLIDEVIGKTKSANFIRPSAYMMFPTSPSGGKLFEDLNALIEEQQGAQELLASLQSSIATLNAQETTAKAKQSKLSSAAKAKILAQVSEEEPALKTAASQLTKAINAVDALLASLLSIESKDAPTKSPSSTNPAAGLISITTSTTTTSLPAALTAKSGSPANPTTDSTPTPSKPTQSSSAPTLSDLLLVESMNNALTSQDGALLLQLHVETATGEIETRGSLWTFFGSAPLRYTGGTVVTYALIEGATGFVKAAGSCSDYQGSSASSDLKQAKAP